MLTFKTFSEKQPGYLNVMYIDPINSSPFIEST